MRSALYLAATALSGEVRWGEVIERAGWRVAFYPVDDQITLELVIGVAPDKINPLFGITPAPIPTITIH